MAKIVAEDFEKASDVVGAKEVQVLHQVPRLDCFYLIVWRVLNLIAVD